MAALSATVVRPWHVQASFDGANIGDMELAVRGANDWLGMVKRDNLLVECAMCGHEFRRGTPVSLAEQFGGEVRQFRTRSMRAAG
jgi:hypothetical protein